MILHRFPNKAIRFIVPAAAGGPGGIIAATIAEKLSQNLKQQVNIVQATSQTAGLLATAQAPADGYTFGMGGASFYLSAALYRKLPFDPYEDFVAVNVVASIANVLVVHPSLPVHNIRDFISYAKEYPGKLRYGSSGYGRPPHIAAAMFEKLADVKLVHMPSKGHVLAGNALCRGELELMFDAVPTSLEHLKAGELRGIGVTTIRRVPVLPDIPTIAECGLTGYDMSLLTGVLAPAGTPDAAILRVSSELAKITASPEVKAHFEGLGMEAVSSTRDESPAFMQGQFIKWAKVLKDVGIEPLDAPL